MKILEIFLLWRLGLFFITFLGSLTFPLAENGGLGAPGPGQGFDYWASWAQWDGGHYFEIARRGYLVFSDYAFFPLYPYLTKALSYLFFNNLILAGLIAANIFFVLFLFIFYQLTYRISNAQVAYTTTVTFLLYPATFFAVSFYSESLFLLLSALVFLILKGKLKIFSKKKFLIAAVLTCLASLTRLVGITLVISLFYSYFSLVQFKIKKLDFHLLHILVAFLGVALYSLILFYKLNDPFKFLTVQTLWERSIQDPISTIFSYIWAIVAGQTRPMIDYLDLSLTSFFLFLLISGTKKIFSSLWIFSMLAILLPASTGTLTGMPRYLLASLGSFIIAGIYLEQRPTLKIPFWASSLILQSILAVRFINGYWVA